MRIAIERGKTVRSARGTRTLYLSYGEIMTILILYNSSSYKCFKYFYLDFALKNLRDYFPNMPCYDRFTAIQKKAFISLLSFLLHICQKSRITGLYYIDSTYLEICKNQRIYKHKTFKVVTQRGKTSVDGSLVLSVIL